MSKPYHKVAEQQRLIEDLKKTAHKAGFSLVRSPATGWWLWHPETDLEETLGQEITEENVNNGIKSLSMRISRLHWAPCHVCDGTGYTHETRCSFCAGTGEVYHGEPHHV